MTKKELKQAMQIACSSVSLEQVDHSVLEGLYLQSFKHVATTLTVVAKLLRELVIQFNGEVDSVELANFSEFAKKKISIIG